MKDTIIWGGVALIVLFGLFLASKVVMPDQNPTGCYSGTTAPELFCGCMGGFAYTELDEVNNDVSYCRMGLSTYKVMDFLCDKIPTDPRCGVQTDLSSFAPRYDTHLVKGQIFENGIRVESASIIYQKKGKSRELLMDKQLSRGWFEIDLSLLPSGWRVGDVGVITILYGGQEVNKTIYIKSSRTQIENILIKREIQ